MIISLKVAIFPRERSHYVVFVSSSKSLVEWNKNPGKNGETYSQLLCIY